LQRGAHGRGRCAADLDGQLADAPVRPRERVEDVGELRDPERIVTRCRRRARSETTTSPS
jgi:hypothetical protein